MPLVTGPDAVLWAIDDASIVATPPARGRAIWRNSRRPLGVGEKTPGLRRTPQGRRATALRHRSWRGQSALSARFKPWLASGPGPRASPRVDDSAVAQSRGVDMQATRAHCATWKRPRLRAEGASNDKIESYLIDQPRLGNAGERRSDLGDVDDRLGKGLRGLLRQVVPHAASDEPVLIFTREFAAISRGFRMMRAVGVAFHSDRGYCDDGPLGEFLFQIVVFPLAVGEVEPPAVIVDHDRDVVRVVEGRRAAVIERGVVGSPISGEACRQMSFEKSRRFLS